MAAKGRSTKFERNPNAKLTAAKVKEMRLLRSLGGWTLEALAEKFGCGIANVSAVVNNRTWVMNESAGD